MEVMSLAALAVVCGAVAIYLWMSLGKLQDQLNGLKSRAEKAEGEAGKATDRAETLRKKLEKQGDSNAYEERSLKEARTRASEAKEELQKTRAALKRAEQQAEELSLKMRKAESQIEELSVMAQVRRPVQPVVVAPVQAAEPVAPPQPMVAEERADDPKIALRRAELEAEREARELERQKLKQERDTQRAQQDDVRLRELCDRLAQERDRWRHEALGRELDLRISRKMAEHNRRAYVMTMGALDLAEDEVYRMKHGRERPEFSPNRAAGFAPDLEAERTAGDRADAAARDDAAYDAAPEVAEAPTEAPVAHEAIVAREDAIEAADASPAPGEVPETTGDALPPSATADA
jgi:hypothetical protein